MIIVPQCYKVHETCVLAAVSIHLAPGVLAEVKIAVKLFSPIVSLVYHSAAILAPKDNFLLGRVVVKVIRS